ncbi:MAG: ferrous iron transport protein [Francisellaceae bacterium]|nr:ferrous iron transport protein [Francisellaceae bacterium]
MMHINQLKAGEWGRILKIEEGSKAYRQKLLALGLIPGATFLVKRIAPLGDPVELQLRNFSIALRKEEAKIILVEKQGDL